MKKVLLALCMFSATQLFAQDELKLSEAFLKSVQEKNFALLKPWVDAANKSLQEKWKQVVENAHRKGFDIKTVKIKRVAPGEKIPNLPMKSIIALYDFNGKEWDDLHLIISKSAQPKLLDIPLTTYMFKLDDERRGKNTGD